jgi:NADH-quinone oxidoreductase subunit G
MDFWGGLPDKSDMAKVKINGKEVTVEDNTLILDAARSAGFEIPTFCYQANLSRLGSCRMCLVEIEGQRKLQPACVTPVMDGMSVMSESKTALTSRSAMFEFLLSNHAMDCPVCDKGGECELQDMVYKHGPCKGKFAEKKRRFHERDYVLSPVIVKNSNRCVQCLRCVRVCKEAVGRGVLGPMGRGTGQEETSFLREYLDCDQCGNCIEVCPVGCFMRRPYRYKARPWDLNSASSICTYCATGCRIKIQSRDGEVVRSMSKFGRGVNGDYLCARGRFGFDFTNNVDRLEKPLLRKGNTFEEIGWDEALALVKKHLVAAGGEKIGAVASARLTNEEFFLLERLVRGLLGSNNIDSNARWRATASSAFIDATGLDRGGTSLTDCVSADTMLVVGTHVSDENPVTDYIIRRSVDTRRLRVITASPRAMKLDSSAMIKLRHGVAREGALLLGVASEVALAAKEAGKTLSTRIAEALEGVDVEKLAVEAGCGADDIKAAGRRLWASEKISLLAGMEFLRFPEGNRPLSILRALLMDIGKIVFTLPVLDRSNQRGAWDMGVHPALSPVYTPVAKPGLDAAGMIDAANDRVIDAMLVMGEDIMGFSEDRAHAAEALGKLKFLAVVDSFMTETAKLATLVLPAATFSEKEGSFTNQEGRVQHIARLLKPRGEARSGFDILSGICKALDEKFVAPDPTKLFDDIKASHHMYSDATICVDDDQCPIIRDNKTVEPEPKLAPAIEPVKVKKSARQFTLITGNHLFYSGWLSRRSDTLRGLVNQPLVEISKADADRAGVKNGDSVRVTGDHHEAVYTLRTKEGSIDGVAFIAENFPEAPYNKFLRKGEGLQKVSLKKLI